MNDTCEIVRDLIPLCADKVASKKTQIYVAEHIKTCDECRKLLKPTKKRSVTTVKNLEVTSDAIPDYNKIAKKITNAQRAALGIASGLILLLTAYDVYLSVQKNFSDKDKD